MADTLAMFLRPFVISWLRFVLPVYKRWREWMKGGGGSENKLELGEGFKKIKEGIFEFDIVKILSGVKDVFKAIAGTLKTVFFDVMFPQLKGWYTKWKELQSQFNTSGVFDTLWAIVKKNMFAKLKDAWKGFEEYARGTTWGTVLFGIKDAIWSVWTWFTKKLEGFSWLGPLKPFAEGIKTKWDEVVGPMVDKLSAAMREKFPKAFAFLDNMKLDDDNEDKGFWAKILSAGKKLLSWINITLNPGFALMQKIGQVAAQKIAETLGDDLGKALTATQKGMQKSVTETDLLIKSLNRIPRNITTTHTIITVRKSRDENDDNNSRWR